MDTIDSGITEPDDDTICISVKKDESIQTNAQPFSAFHNKSEAGGSELLTSDERLALVFMQDSWRKLVRPDVLVQGLRHTGLITGKDELAFSTRQKTGSCRPDFLYHRLFFGATYKEVCQIKEVLLASGLQPHEKLAAKLPCREDTSLSKNEGGHPGSASQDSGCDFLTPTPSFSDSLPPDSDDEEGENTEKTLQTEEKTVTPENDESEPPALHIPRQESGSFEVESSTPSTSSSFADLSCLFSATNNDLPEADGLRGVNIDEEYENFLQQSLERNYIQGCYRSRTTMKIYIDIDKTYIQDALDYFRENFKSFWEKNILELVAQEPVVYYIGEPNEESQQQRKRKCQSSNPNDQNCCKKSCQSTNFIAAGKGQTSFKSKIQAGGIIMPVCNELINLVSGQTTLSQVKQVIKSETDSVPPCGTIAGFVQDNDQQIYMLTVRHVLKGYFCTRPGWQEEVNLNPGCERDECLPVFTEIYPQTSPSQMFELGREYFGFCGVKPGSRIGIDLALVKIGENIKDHPMVKLQPLNHQMKQVELNTFQGPEYDMYKKDVEKDGITTGLTNGTILPITRDHKFPDFKTTCVGTFVIKSKFTDKCFALPGDSGALITSVVDDKTSGCAYGLVFAGTSEYRFMDDVTRQFITYKNVTYGLRLNNAFKFADMEWGIRGLRFLDSNSSGGVLKCQPPDLINFAQVADGEAELQAKFS